MTERPTWDDLARGRRWVDYGAGTEAAWDLLQDELAEAEDAYQRCVDGSDRPRRRTADLPHCYGNRKVWQPVDPADPWSPLVPHPQLRDRGEGIHFMTSRQAERLAGV